MNRIREGDMVVRKSYGKDIVFYVESIVTQQREKIAILKGLTIRITADSSLGDLEKVSLKQVRENLRQWEERILEES